MCIMDLFKETYNDNFKNFNSSVLMQKPKTAPKMCKRLIVVLKKKLKSEFQIENTSRWSRDGQKSVNGNEVSKIKGKVC